MQSNSFMLSYWENWKYGRLPKSVNHSNNTQLSLVNKIKKIFRYNYNKNNHQKEKDIELNTIENTKLMSNSPTTSHKITIELKSIKNNVNMIRSSMNPNNNINQINS